MFAGIIFLLLLLARTRGRRLCDQMGELYAFDVNGDGWPDIVSSYQPFWNILFGPVLPGK